MRVEIIFESPTRRPIEARVERLDPVPPIPPLDPKWPPRRMLQALTEILNSVR